jgi:thiamine kinase
MVGEHDSHATAALDKCLATIPALRGAKPAGRLAGGPASDSWLIEIAGRRLVLRIDRPLAQCLLLDRSAEFEVMQQVARAGFGPTPVWADPNSGVLLTVFVEGECLSSDDVHEPQTVRRIARRLQELHSLRLPGPVLDMQKTLDYYARCIASLEAGGLAARACALLVELDQGDAKYCLCHNDLGHRNIVDTGRLILIDWEYAALADPWFDLAGVVVQNELPDNLAGLLLQEYSGVAASGELLRLQKYARLYRLVAELWQMTVDCKQAMLPKMK